MNHKNNQPFETREHDLTGYASLELKDPDSFNSFAARLAGYDTARFEPAAFKVFIQDQKAILTLYAHDKERNQASEDSLPVKKFKMEMDVMEFMGHISRFDFVVSDGRYEIEDMKVINK